MIKLIFLLILVLPFTLGCKNISNDKPSPPKSDFVDIHSFYMLKNDRRETKIAKNINTNDCVIMRPIYTTHGKLNYSISTLNSCDIKNLNYSVVKEIFFMSDHPSFVVKNDSKDECFLFTFMKTTHNKINHLISSVPNCNI